MRWRLLVVSGVAGVTIGAFGLEAQTALSTQSISNIAGVGARAMGMGGAFTAIADDATAASWNPAGLAQLTRPEASVVYDDFQGTFEDHGYAYSYSDSFEDTFDGSTFREDYSYSSTVQRQDMDTDASGLSFASGTYPFKIGSRLLVAQVSVRRLVRFPSLTSREDFSYSDRYEDYLDEELIDSGASTGTDTYTDTEEISGGIDSLSASLAMALTETLRAGLSLNYVSADTTERGAARRDFGGAGGYTTSGYERTIKYDDFTVDVGVQWQALRWLTLGAVYHLGFDGSYDTRIARTRDENRRVYQGRNATSSTGDLSWPDGWALGVAFRPIDPLTIAVDYGETSWADAEITEFPDVTWVYSGTRDASGKAIYVPGPPSVRSELDYPSLRTNQQDTSAVRLGAEYLFARGAWVFPLRAGYFEEEQFVGAYPTARGDTPPPTAKGWSVGAGLVFAAKDSTLQFDVAWVRTKIKDDVRFSESGEIATGWTYSETFSTEFQTSSDRLVASFIVRF